MINKLRVLILSASLITGSIGLPALIATPVVISVAVTQTSCTKDQLVANAKDVLSALKDAQPFIIRLVPGQITAFAKAMEAAEKLVTAVQNSDKTTALALLADIVPTVASVAATLTNNAEVLAILAVANIALHFLVNHLPAAAKALARSKGAQTAQSVDVLLAFKNEQVWGCAYHSERCTQ